MDKGFAESEPHGFWSTKKEIYMVEVITSKISEISKMTEIHKIPEKVSDRFSHHFSPTF